MHWIIFTDLILKVPNHVKIIDSHILMPNLTLTYTFLKPIILKATNHKTASFAYSFYEFQSIHQVKTEQNQVMRKSPYAICEWTHELF